MNKLRKILFIFLGLFVVNFAFAALTISVTSGAANLGTLSLEEGFHGQPAGNIQLQVNKDGPADAYVYANMITLPTSVEGYTIPEGILRWKGFWSSIDGTPNNGANFVKGVNDWVTYRLNADDVAVRIQATSQVVSITFGSQIVRIPAVQPQGAYTARIMYSIVE